MPYARALSVAPADPCPPPRAACRYSTLAGFLDLGEPLEAAVAREVAEEVGRRAGGRAGEGGGRSGEVAKMYCAGMYGCVRIGTRIHTQS